jgi:hypothetical protein
MLVAMKTRESPLLILVVIVILGSILGFFGGLFFYHQDKQDFLRVYKETGMGAPTEIGDSALWFVFIGVGLGLLISLAVGISVYVIIKQRNNEQNSILELHKGIQSNKKERDF